MGTDTLIDRSNSQIIDEDFLNLFNRAFEGDFVGRSSSTGAAASGQNLGTSSIPWGTVHTNFINLGGDLIDQSLVTSRRNRVISGAIKTTSNFPDYLRPAGAGNGNTFDLLGATTDLVLDINGETVTIDEDFNFSGSLTAPASNNTCLINDGSLTGQASSKNLGEDGTVIPVDNMGSEITALIGNYVAMINTDTDEIFTCFVESSTELTKCRRGFFFDENGDAIERAGLTNNDTLQLCLLGYVLTDDSDSWGVNFYTPIISGNEPTAPATLQLWYDLENEEWKIYFLAAWISTDATFVGYVAIDDTDCIGARSEYFGKRYSEYNTLEVEIVDADTIQTKTKDSIISVDGNDIHFNFKELAWDGTADFESGVSRAASNLYWLYITEDGVPIISDKKPYDETGFLRGWYHPHESWRYVGEVWNNGSDDFGFMIYEKEKKGDLIIYREGTGDFTVTCTPTPSSIPHAWVGVYQDNDGFWHGIVNLNINFSTLTTATFQITITGIKYRYDQSVNATNKSASVPLEQVYADQETDDINGVSETTSLNNILVNADLLLYEKPTWATRN